MFIRRTAVFACLFSCNMEVTARRNSLKGLRLVASENQDFKREAAGQEYCFPLKAILCCFFVSCPVVKARGVLFQASILQHKTYYILLCSTGGYISFFVWV